MAFRKGANKLGHKTNSINNDIDKSIVNAYKKSEEILNSGSSFTEKIPCLIEVWKQARLYSVEPQKNYVIHLMDWLKRHTLNIILTGDWKKYKDIYEDILINEVAHCELAFKRFNPNFSLRCKKLAEIIRDPWGNNVLHRLLNRSDVVITQEELEFFAIETGYIISMRLKMLCESHCEDLALNLATTCLQCYKVAEEQSFNINATEDQKRFILDTYIALLFKFKKTSTIIVILKTLPLQQGLDLVKRFSNKRISISKIWRYSKKITHLAAQIYITAAILKPPEDNLEILKQLLTIWLSLDVNSEESLTQAIRRILQAADSAVHMYIFCELIYNKFQITMKPFTIELFIRALTTDMNDLERQKNEENSLKVTEITNRLALGFLRLADVLDDHLKVTRECVLTAFSLQPNELTMQRVIMLAKRSGYEVLDTGQKWKCKLHPPVKETDEVLWQCSECGEDMSKIEFPSALNTDTALCEALVSEELGLSSQLCDDLAVVIAGPRYQFLSWRLEWTDLNNLCILYLNDPDRTKNLVKELKFVQIDYSMFTHIKKEPEDDELAGIERGYEMYLQDEEDDEIGSSEDSVSLDSRFNGLGSDGTGESPIRLLPFLPSTSKQSDPNVLKSLRMFRPTLKRTKENCSTTRTSEVSPNNKVFIGNSEICSSNMQPSKVHTISSSLFNDTNSFECLSNPFFKERNYTDSISALNQGTRQNTITIPCSRISEENRSVVAMESDDVNWSNNYSLTDYGSSFNEMKGDDDVRSRNEHFTDNYKIHLLSSKTINDKTIHENIRLTSPVVEFSRKRSRSCSEIQGPKSPSSTDINFLDKTSTNVDTTPQDSFQSEQRESKDTNELQQSTSTLNGNNPSTDTDSLQILSDTCTLKSVRNFETFCSTHCKYIKIDKLTDNDDNENCLLAKFPLKEVKVVLDRILVPNSKLSNIELTSTSSTYTRRRLYKLQGNFKNAGAKQFSEKEKDDSASHLPKVDSAICLKKNAIKIPNLKRNTLNPLVLLQRMQSVDSTVSKVTDDSDPASRSVDSKFHSEISKSASVQNASLKKSWKNPNLEELSKNENNVERKENIADIKNIIFNISEEKNTHRKDTLVTDKLKKVITENQKPKTFGNLYENTNKSSRVTNNSPETIIIRREDRKLNEIKPANSIEHNKNKMIAADVHTGSKNEKSISQSTVRWLVNPKTTQNSNYIDNTYKKYIKKEHRGREKFKNSIENDNRSINARYTNLLKHLKEQVAVLTDRSSNKENEKCTNFKKVENDCSEIELTVQTDLVEESSSFNPENRNGAAAHRNRSKSFCHEKIFPRIKLKRPNSVCGQESSYFAKTIFKPQSTINNDIINSNVSNTEHPIKKDERCTESFEHAIKKEPSKATIVNPSENSVDCCSFINNSKHFTRTNLECDQQDYNARRSNDTVCDNLFTDFAYDDLKMEDLIKFNTKQWKGGNCDTTVNTNNIITLNEADKDMLNELKENNMSKTSKGFPLRQDFDNGILLRHKRKNCDDESQNENGANRKKMIVKQNSSEELNKNVNSVLSGVPGLNDLEMIQPQYTNSLIQVVQVSDPSISAAPTQNSLTSTQVTPHIQRIGQPRADKPDNNNTNNAPVNSSSVITSLATSPPSKSSVSDANPTIINILQNQVRSSSANQTIRPVQVGPVLRPAGIITAHSIQRTRAAPPVINILPQQIIRPATIVSCSSRTTPASSNSETQTNEVHQAVSNSHEDVGQLVTSGRLTSTTALKTIVGASAEQSRIVQFICKSSDGKIIPVTSLTPNKIVKVAVTQPVSSSASDDANISNPSLDNTFTKLIQPIKTNSDTTESSEALPKFQQAFGKSYQGNLETVQKLTTPDNENNNNSRSLSNEIKSEKHALSETDKIMNSSINRSHVKATLLPNLHHIQGSVIYSHQGVGQTINLIPPGKGQVIRIAASNPEQVSLVKDSIIHNKMSALLAAALQGRQQQPQQQQQSQSNTSNSTEADSSSEDSLSQSPTMTTIKVTPQRQTLVSSARIVKPVVHLSSNVIRSGSNSQSNLSSTTLEQLREFDMVYKQVKERSNTGSVPEVSVQSESSESSPPQISVTYLNQNQKLSCAPVVVVSSYCTVQSAISPALSVSSQGRASPCVTPSPSANFKGNSKSSKSKSIKAVTTHASKASPLPKPQQKPQEDEHTAQRIFDILAEYAEQLRNSPDLNNKPAPRRRSNPPTNPSQNTKRKKNTGTKKVGVQGSSSSGNVITSDTEVDDSRTAGSEDSSCGVVQVTLQDEDPSSANPISSENPEASSSTNPKQQLILTEANSHTRNLILADSSVGEAFKMSNTAVLMPGNYIMPVSMVKGGQQIRVVSGNSKILAAVPNRSGPNMLLFQSFLNQSRKTNISSVKYSTVQPVTAGISSQTQSSVVLPSTTSNLTSFTVGQSVTVKKANESERLDVNNFNGEFLLTISSNSKDNVSNLSENPVSPDKVTSFVTTNNCKEIKGDTNCDMSQITSLTTCAISKMDSNCGNATTTQSDDKRSDGEKAGGIRKERIQSVLVAPGSVSSPMLCQNTPNYTKHTQAPNMPVSSTKDDYVSTERKVKEVLKQSAGIQSYQNKNKKSQGGVQHLDRELHQLSLQRKQAALERELRLQKSLSEECEDLGVDEPSTSELFPEADIYFDSNNSPSFDQSSQEIKKANQSQSQPIQITMKSETKPNVSLFEDDDNSASFRSDFLFDDPVGYRSTEMELEYDRSHGLTNGQKNVFVNKKEVINEDSTLLQNCGSVTDVTILSPVIPESCDESRAAISMNKCKYKYSNRRKGGDRIKTGVCVENWPIEPSNAENDIDLNKTNTCVQSPGAQLTDEDRLKLVKIGRVEDDYVEVCSEEDEEVGGCGGSVSGRGARRSVKKLCSCCNGPQDGGNTILRKRPASRPHTPALNKKSLVNKKR